MLERATQEALGRYWQDFGVNRGRKVARTSEVKGGGRGRGRGREGGPGRGEGDENLWHGFGKSDCNVFQALWTMDSID
jgi:hypothetical protein